MLPHDPTGKDGSSVRLPDVVTVLEPKEESKVSATPHGQNMFNPPQQQQQQQQPAQQAANTTAQPEQTPQ